MPAHVHADEEELFYVVRGEGVSWQDGRAYAVGAGDCILHRAQAEAHTILGAGAGLDVLAFSGGLGDGLTWLPRARAWWNGPHWLPHDGPGSVRRRGGRRATRGPRARGAAPTDDRRGWTTCRPRTSAGAATSSP